MSRSLLSAARRHPHRTLSTLTPTALNALDAWIATPKSLTLTDTLSPAHLADLYITLPTRDHHDRCAPPRSGTLMEYAHHLAFFHPRTPERLLRADGTEAHLCPPAPFTRRMWAGGRMWWASDHDHGDGGMWAASGAGTPLGAGLRVGETAHARAAVVHVEKRGFGGETGGPMVFVTQRIEITPDAEQLPAVVEERTHVFLGHAAGERIARRVNGLPRPQFSFSFTPTPTTLFRFSALTFNAHHIHLDKEYAQSEGYPERLVHGPLTALMLLETLLLHHPTARPRAFAYRARNPVVVGRSCTVHGALTRADGNWGRAEMWCVDEQGVVGMTGNVAFVL